MKLTPGKLITEIELPSIEGEKFSIKKIKGKKTLLTFYRFATCPFCNLRIHEITERYNELGENFEIIAIFNSSQDYLAKVMEKHTAPCTILAEENFEYFSIFDEEKSLDNLEKFCSINGPKFYKLPVNTDQIELIEEGWTVPEYTIYQEIKIKNFMGGKEINWKLKA